MKFLQHLIRSFREASNSYSYDLVADSEFGWTEDDGKRLSEFFASETGRKLKSRLTNYVCRCAIEATRKSDNVQYNVGQARGVALCVNAIEQHFIASPQRIADKSEEQSQESVLAGLALN